MRIMCCGGVGEQGRSCLLLKEDDGAVLMADCGVQREFSPGLPGRYPVLPPDLPERFPLLLTHTHEDHVASIPWLIAQGYRPEIHTTRRTATLGPDYCRTWLKAVDKAIAATGGQRPYEEKHIQAMDWHILPDGELSVGPWRIRHGLAAHTPGSCWFHVTHKNHPERSIVISGDWTARNLVYPAPQFPACDLFITDASGSDGDGEGLDKLEGLLRLSLETPLLLPLPRLGRCQEMLAFMASMPELVQKSGAVAMEAPLVDALAVWLEDEAVAGQGRASLELARKLFDDGTWIRFTRPEEVPSGPRVIGATDAMLSVGPSAALSEQVLAQGGLVVFSGHAALGTPGRTLLDSQNPRVMRLPWKIHPERADVAAAVSAVRASKAMLVHTPGEKALRTAQELRGELGITVFAPEVGDVIEPF